MNLKQSTYNCNYVDLPVACKRLKIVLDYIVAY